MIDNASRSRADALMVRLDDRSSTKRGAAWLLLGALLLTAMTATTKLVADDVNPFQVTFFRALFGLGLLSPIVMRSNGISVLRTTSLRLHLARGVISASGMTATVYAVANLDLATATAIAFTTPLFIVLLASVFLGEQVSPVRWVGTAVGLGGVLLISPPGRELGLAAGAAVLGALAVGAAKLLVKELASRDSHQTILVYLNLSMMTVTSIPTVLFWQPLGGHEVLALLVIGGLSMGGQACAIHGYKMARASAVAPVEYSRLLWAVVFGFALFGHVPGPNTLIGAVVIIVGSLLATLASTRRPRNFSRPARVTDRVLSRRPQAVYPLCQCSSKTSSCCASGSEATRVAGPKNGRVLGLIQLIRR